MKTAGIAICTSRFAQHVVGISKTLLLFFIRALNRLFDGLTQHKLTTHFFHHTRDGLTDNRLTQSFHRAVQGFCNRTFLLVIKHFARDIKRPCRSVDERGVGLPKMMTPCTWRDFIFNESVHRCAIWHTQKRFRQTHKRNAFITG